MLVPSPNIIMVIKSRKMILGRHMACVGEKMNTLMVLVAIPEGNNCLDDLEVDGRTMLRGRTWIRFMWLRIRKKMA